MTPAVVGGDDAGGEVAASGATGAATTGLRDLLVDVGVLPAEPDLDNPPPYEPVSRDDFAVLAQRVLDGALYVTPRWYCPTCHFWPLAPGACERCAAPLQAVYLATIPREITP